MPWLAGGFLQACGALGALGWLWSEPKPPKGFGVLLKLCVFNQLHDAARNLKDVMNAAWLSRRGTARSVWSAWIWLPFSNHLGLTRCGRPPGVPEESPDLPNPRMQPNVAITSLDHN